MKAVVSVFVEDLGVRVLAHDGAERYRSTVKIHDGGDLSRHARMVTESLHRALDTLGFVDGTVFVVGGHCSNVMQWGFVCGVTLGYAARFGCRGHINFAPPKSGDPLLANVRWVKRQKAAA